MSMPPLLIRAAAALVLLAPSRALAARYDPDFDRAALRQAATLSNSTVVDAAARPLEPEQAPAISAGLDEGLRQASLAADAARSLDAAARQRAAAMETEAGERSLDRRIKELQEPVAAERARFARLSVEHDELKQKVSSLADEERKKLLPLLDKAAGGLRAAASALRPLEDAVGLMGERGLVMKELRQDSLGPLVEISSAAAGAIRSAEELPPAAAAAKASLGALGQEPRAAARTRAWEKLDVLRGITRQLFQDADRACNRADDFRRLSAAFAQASTEFESARRTAAAGPAGARSFLDEAKKLQAEVRQRLKPD